LHANISLRDGFWHVLNARATLLEHAGGHFCGDDEGFDLMRVELGFCRRKLCLRRGAPSKHLVEWVGGGGPKRRAKKQENCRQDASAFHHPQKSSYHFSVSEAKKGSFGDCTQKSSPKCKHWTGGKVKDSVRQFRKQTLVSGWHTCARCWGCRGNGACKPQVASMMRHVRRTDLCNVFRHGGGRVCGRKAGETAKQRAPFQTSAFAFNVVQHGLHTAPSSATPAVTAACCSSTGLNSMRP
jgi:hypothetical protein